MKLLIDADYIVYKACAGAEYDIDWGNDVIMVASKYSEAFNNAQRDLKKIDEKFLWDTPTEMILFFSSSVNFRKQVMPAYKGHRNRKKPCGYVKVINELSEHYQVIRLEGLEADDALGIYATKHEGNILVSPDKDMRQIPGRLFNMEDTEVIDPEDGRRWHLVQTLAGDQTDGYSGAPGFGVKTSYKWFDENGYTWEAVVKAFESKGLSEDTALMNARLAKILDVNHYDERTQKPILFAPNAST